MKLTPELIKAFDSSYVVQNFPSYPGYLLKYRGRFFYDGEHIKIFYNEKSAKKYLLAWVKQTFWQGEYWQQYKDNVKQQKGYEIDLSATIKLLPQYGPVSRFDLPENKKMFKELRDALLEEQIVTIERAEFDPILHIIENANRPKEVYDPTKDKLSTQYKTDNVHDMYG